MKINFILSENILQINMTPESEIEEEMIKILSKYEGFARVKSCRPFVETMGGYLRKGDYDDRTVALVIRKEKSDE